MKPHYWNEKVCLVTGASAGLGLEICRSLAQADARVLMVARKRPPLEAAAETLQALGGQVVPFAADVTSDADLQRLADYVQSEWGVMDMLCNCAGRSSRGEVLKTPLDDFRDLMELNFFATVRTSQVFAPLLIDRRGHLVNIGSLASRFGPRYLAGYPASKFAVAAYSQQLRLELGEKGLHVLLVCPGPIRRREGAARYTEPAVPEEAQQPGGGAKLRGLDPTELAEAILKACERRQVELVLPRKARVLAVLSQLSPRWGDWLLSRMTAK